MNPQRGARLKKVTFIRAQTFKNQGHYTFKLFFETARFFAIYNRGVKHCLDTLCPGMTWMEWLNENQTYVAGVLHLKDQTQIAMPIPDRESKKIHTVHLNGPSISSIFNVVLTCLL